MISPFFVMCNFLFASTLGIFADYERSGTKNVPKSEPLLVIANHQSNLDPPVVARSINRRTFFLAKKEAFANPLVTLILKMWGAHPLARGKADVQAVRWALKKLKQPGQSITLFPEGTRSNGSMRRAQPGPASIALRSGAVVLPVGISGTEVLGPVVRVVKPSATIRVNIGRPFKVIDKGGDRRAMLTEMTTEMMGRVAELVPQSYRGVYADAAGAARTYTADVLPDGETDAAGEAAGSGGGHPTEAE